MRLENFDVDETFMAKVLSTTRITDDSAEDIRELVLEIDQKTFAFEIGQSIGVIVDGPHDQFGHPHHFRLYTIADTPHINENKKPEVKLCVKRCDYIDEYSGERYQGIASNYLCDLQVGAKIKICGPFGIPWRVPADKSANLILIGMGTGIAPFRAFVKHIYKNIGGWTGKVFLFHGARSGLELLYMNDQNDDFTQYYDEGTFEAFKALSPRPHWADPIAMDYALEERADEMLSMLMEHGAYIYVAGREDVSTTLDHLFSTRVGPDDVWQHIKSDLKSEGRWAELIY